MFSARRICRAGSNPPSGAGSGASAWGRYGPMPTMSTSRSRNSSTSRASEGGRLSGQADHHAAADLVALGAQVVQAVQAPPPIRVIRMQPRVQVRIARFHAQQVAVRPGAAPPPPQHRSVLLSQRKRDTQLAARRGRDRLQRPGDRIGMRGILPFAPLQHDRAVPESVGPARGPRRSRPAAASSAPPRRCRGGCRSTGSCARSGCSTRSGRAGKPPARPCAASPRRPPHAARRSCRVRSHPAGSPGPRDRRPRPAPAPARPPNPPPVMAADPGAPAGPGRRAPARARACRGSRRSADRSS